MNDTTRLRRTAALVVAMVLLLPTWSGEAHEIPADVTIQAFVRPEAGTLSMLVRVPLEAMRDYEWPTREPGYLIVSEADSLVREATQLWIADYLEMFENGESLGRPSVGAVRIASPGDRAFVTYERALENVRSQPLPDAVELPPGQAMLDVLLQWPIESMESDFAIESGLRHLGLRTVTVLRFLPPGGAERAFQFSDDPGRLELDPRWHQAAWRFVLFGFEHILDGIDHILFLLCLVVPLRSFWALVPIVTSFTIAHSITLVAAALGMTPNVLWFPALIETLIALSIVFMAFENILGTKLDKRWMVAFGFGLVHGFGFSFALSESLQFAGAHLLMSLVSFNVGVELGQLFLLAIMVPVLRLSFRSWLPPVLGVVVLSALLAHTGWHWMLERGGDLLQYDFVMPLMDAAFVAALLRWIMLVVIVGGALWGLRGLFGWLDERVPAMPEGKEAAILPGATEERNAI
ncbi:MAG: HupE/UreJ family protein [Longimicrobiales bacterium]|nr:HupE/UreJ family protein [Longimicrobiales bacterium]